MNRRFMIVAMAFALLAIVGSGAAYAQSVTIVNVPFAFTAGAKQLPAGKYEVRADDTTQTITLTPEHGAATVVGALTRLGLRHPIENGELVFDKVENNYTLSELWVPATDGYLIHDTKQPHTHQMLKGEKKG